MTKQFIKKLAKVFNDPPEITPDTENTAVNDEIKRLLDSVYFNSALLTIDRMVELSGMVGVMPKFNPHTEKVELELLMPDRCIVFTYDDYPNTAKAIAYRINSQGSDPQAKQVNEYMYWTKDESKRVTFKTDWTIDTETDVKRNPYGKIPVAWFMNEHKMSSNSFWLESKPALIEQ